MHKINRVSVQALDDILGVIMPVLDHGFVRVIDYMGDDSSIVQAARVSYGLGTKKKNEDESLIRYLMKNYHSSPFEMCEIKLHIKMPIFVARQWIRHRTANVNEYSARYSVIGEDFYIPDFDTISKQSMNNKQCREIIPLSLKESEEVYEKIKKISEACYDAYLDLLEETPSSSGVAREIARMVLPVNYYTEVYWKIDLHNLLGFVRLRNDNKAQYEIRQYANLIFDKIIKNWVPVSYQAFLDYRKNNT